LISQRALLQKIEELPMLIKVSNFAFQLSSVTGSHVYELERRLGHRSQHYIQWYTNPPEDITARYIEEF
jgi:hypothetical protein